MSTLLVDQKVPAQDGKRLMHARLTINGSALVLSDEFPDFGDHGGTKSRSLFRALRGPVSAVATSPPQRLQGS